MKKKGIISLIACGAIAVGATLGMTACKSNKGITVWASQDEQETLKKMIAQFQEANPDFDTPINTGVVGAGDAVSKLSTDATVGADVYCYANDQLVELINYSALAPIPDTTVAKLKEENDANSVEAGLFNGKYYGYPYAADNGYFLYYNKQYFTPDDIKTLDRLLEVAEQNGKKITMDWSSAWYVYAFFGNTGLEAGLNDDGITNFCTWNKTDGPIKGVDVANAMLSIAQSPAFLSTDEAGFLSGVRDGSVIAGVSGVWNAMAMEEAWGKDYGAAKLPTYTCCSRQIQMASFSGYKLIGVNAYSKHNTWAARLAEWIANEKNQQLRFEMRGQGPANAKAAASASVQDSPAIAALIAQSEFSRLQRIGGNFWDPVSAFATNMAAGNPERIGLQEQLDVMVEGVTAP